MASPNDNIALKDGNDSPFKMRGKDVSVAQDGSLQAVRHLSTLYPVDYGTGGCYHTIVKSGSMAAGLAASAPILAFRNPSATFNALMRRLRFNFWSLGTGFTAGLMTFEAYVARSFTAMDTGGSAFSFTGSQAKLATSMASSSMAIQYGSTATLTAGTRTLDNGPVGSLNCAAPTTTYTAPLGPSDQHTMFEKLGSDHPVLLAQNEGFVIQASVPATGIWSWAAKIEWDEVPLVNF